VAARGGQVPAEIGTRLKLNHGGANVQRHLSHLSGAPEVAKPVPLATLVNFRFTPLIPWLSETG
jgi:hypothetical protein